MQPLLKLPYCSKRCTPTFTDWIVSRPFWASFTDQVQWPILKYLAWFYTRGKRESYLVLAIAPGQWNSLKTFHFFANFGRKSIAQDLVAKLFSQWKWGDTLENLSDLLMKLYLKEDQRTGNVPGQDRGRRRKIYSLRNPNLRSQTTRWEMLSIEL